MLKVELHCHTNDDPEDYFISYTSKQLIDHYAKLRFDVVAITLHNKRLHTKELVNYAKKKGILLISGIEKTIEGRHVLLYNISEKELRSITTLDDVRAAKKRNPTILAIAPHPFHPLVHSLGSKLKKNIDIFDAVEWSWYYHRWCNPNKKSKKIAEKHHKPMVGTGDVHFLKYVGKTYSLINSEKDVTSVIEAVKKGKVHVVTHSLSFGEFVSYILVTLKIEIKRLFL